MWLLILQLLLCEHTDGVPDVVQRAAVQWSDPEWTGELGTMPLGNGDISLNVWVEGSSGDLLFYISKSDAFDENAQPVKLGRVRASFDPPLWQRSDANATYTSVPRTIGAQNAEIPAPRSCSSTSVCVAESAAMCNAIPSCVAYALSPKWNGGLKPELYSVGKSGAYPNNDWTFYYNNNPLPVFKQTLNVSTATVEVTTALYSVTVYVDMVHPAVRVDAKSAGAFTFQATLERVRTEVRPTKLGRGFCYPRFDTPDVVLKQQYKDLDGVVWYHRNDYAHLDGHPSYWDSTLSLMGVAPSTLPDWFHNSTFGGYLGGAGLKVSPDRTAVSAQNVHTVAFDVWLLTEQTPNIDGWLSHLQSLVASSSAVSRKDLHRAHANEWALLWERSYIDISAQGDIKDVVANINNHYIWQRFMDLANGRNAASAIKFNGQAFTVNNTGKGPSYRSWGACYWWQNTRQPYYNAHVAGDLDLIRPAFDFYARSLPLVTARTHAEFGIAGAYWPETMTQFGMYNPGDWGCSTPSKGPSTNKYIRFHTTGSLELCMLLLDDYVMTLNTTVLHNVGLPVCTAVMTYYRERYPHRDAHNKTDMFPAQALETYQCPDPTSRVDCVTNPATDLSGLNATLTRLLSLPSSLTSAADRGAWTAQLAALPPLSTRDGIILPGEHYPSHSSNSENTALYSVHPFRMFGVGKSNIELAQQTYNKRPHPCNDGWCQDVIDAAMLGLADEAAKQVALRAAAGPAKGWRFGGFAAHYQDYEPSLDHYSFMRTGLHYMLISPLDDNSQRIALFPAWPSNWDVKFKLHGPLSTVVEASCVNGTATVAVTPEERRKDVVLMGCSH